MIIKGKEIKPNKLTKIGGEIPFYVMSSNKPGPTILLSGGLHGDEYNGIEIVKGIIRRGFKINKGNLIMIPILNKYGYKKGLRYDDSNLDINRCFTRASENRVCRFLMDEIIPHIDYGIDFHTGGAKRTNYPQIRCSVGDNFQLEVAKKINLPLIVNSKRIKGSFRNYCAKLGKPIFVFEGGHSKSTDREIIIQGIEKTLSFLSKEDIIDYRVSNTDESVILNKTKWIKNNTSGTFNTFYREGDFVKGDTIIGEVIGKKGVKEFIRSKKDSIIIGMETNTSVVEDSALYHMGY
jgi:predicted deacylase